MKYLKLLILFVTDPVVSSADESKRPYSSPEERSPWSFSLDVGYLHQQDTDIDTGGEFSVDRFNLGLSANRELGYGNSIGLSLAYGNHDYDFEGLGGDLWDDVHTFTLGVPIRYIVSPSLSVFALPNVSAKYENGANVSDSVTGGLIAGASFKVSESLSIGPGFGINSELEDSVNIFPILLIRWQLSDAVELKTGSGLGASQGPGLVLSWQASEVWKLSLGSRYERLQFRLNDQGFIPDGVGEESGVPVYLGAGYKLSDSTELSFYGGVRFGGSLEIEDDSGDRIGESDYDAAGFFGINLNSKF